MAWYNEKFECPNPPDCAANQMVPPSEWNAMVAYLKDKIRGMPFTAPGAGDDGKYIKYVHATPGFVLDTPAGGGDMLKSVYDPNIDGIIAAAQIGSLPASKITSGAFALARIPTPLTGKDADSVDGCDAGIATGNVFKIPPSIAQGDIFYVNASGNIVRLPHGTNGHFLKTQGAAANPIWAAGVGGVTTWLALTDTPGSFSGQGGKFVKVAAGEAALEFGMPAGAGDVVGPASSVNNRIALFDGTTGKLIKDSGILGADIFKKDGSVAATGDFLPDSTGIRKLGSTIKHWGDIYSDNHNIYSTLYGGFKVGQDLLPNATETHLLGSSTYKWDIIWARTVDFDSVCTDLINRMSAGDYINFTDGIEFNGAAGRSIINITHLLPKTTGASDLGSSTLKFRNIYTGDIIAWDGLSGGIKCEQDWLPFTTNTYDLGSASYYWKNLFLNGYIDLLGLLYVDTIAERTAGVGVTIDTCLIKDGKAADTLKIKGKTVDDAAIGDDKILVYKTAGTKLVYEVKPTGGGQEIVTATLVVAANDSKDKDRADYKCDGTADNVEIQQALDALTAVGGKVVLLEGNYSGILDLDIESKQALVGQGPSTRLSGMDIEIEANASEILIADMYINGDIDLNSHTISSSTFRNLSGLDYMLKQTNTNLRSNENILHNVTAKRFAIIGDDNRVSNCFSQSSTSIAFSLTGTRNWLTNCHAFSAYDEAFFLNTATHSILTNITSRDNRYIPIWINSSSHKNVINGGMIIGGNATGGGWTKLIRVQGDDNKISDITIIVKETKTTAAIIVEGTAAKTMLTDLKFIDEGAGSPTEISDSGTNTRLRDNVGFNGAWLIDA